ncbi:MAG: hypothetical protein BroJett011_24460 [Chloroflexota bacterium]|nr:MAG: hypothetical protein BroJett011_24460 [Chloroflexota bacterium]
MGRFNQEADSGTDYQNDSQGNPDITPYRPPNLARQVITGSGQLGFLLFLLVMLSSFGWLAHTNLGEFEYKKGLSFSNSTGALYRLIHPIG